MQSDISNNAIIGFPTVGEEDLAFTYTLELHPHMLPHSPFSQCITLGLINIHY